MLATIHARRDALVFRCVLVMAAIFGGLHMDWLAQVLCGAGWALLLIGGLILTAVGVGVGGQRELDEEVKREPPPRFQNERRNRRS